jgi:alkyl sulfatase BDS1-like metallo-beta-lactamase superfamily hydrolase
MTLPYDSDSDSAQGSANGRLPANVDSRIRGTPKPQLIKVTDRIYCSSGYSVSNALYVITDKSVVVIDTTETQSAARAALADFREITELPISYIIYTHFHGDHIRGARVFHSPETRVIAHKKMPEELEKKNLLLFHSERVSAVQVKSALPAKTTGASLTGPENGYVQPDITFENEYKFEEGGVQFELFHTEGETVDHLMIWLPQERALFPGDLFYNSFPMLGNPMKPDRPVLAWANSLKRMRELCPDYLVPSHNLPLQGADVVDSALENYETAIRFVHDETVKYINQGLAVDEIRARVRLPKELARLPYLRQSYGTVRWAVIGIFRQYTGWYYSNPSELNPADATKMSNVWLEITGGARPILDRAREALHNGDCCIALSLTDVVLAARPRNRDAIKVRLAALTKLANSSKNGMERNIYRASAGALRRRMQRLERTRIGTQKPAITLSSRIHKRRSNR